MQASQTRQQQANDRKRKAHDAALLALIAFLGLRLDQYARQYIAGTLSQERFLFWAMATIRQAHYSAATIGAQAAGGVQFNTYTVATRTAAQQESFVDAFARDLANGRYDPKSDGGQGAAARKRRFELYGLRLTGTANAVMLAVAQAQGLDVLWELGENEDHCPDCPRIAARGWMKATELHQVPGDGQTICLVCCKCSLLFSNGMRSFRNNP